VPTNPVLRLASANGRLYLFAGGMMYTLTGGEWNGVRQTFPGSNLLSVGDILFAISNSLWWYENDQWVQVSEPLEIDPLSWLSVSLVADTHSLYLGYGELGDLSQAFVVALPPP
jgi:hypothetical protein